MLWFICIFVEIRMDLKLLVMLTKDKLNRTIQSLPDTFSIDQLIDQLIFMEKVELGYQQSEDGKVVANEEAKIIIDKWSK
jgi:hypothetical protein